VAEEVVSHGFKVLMIEEHTYAGARQHCTGKLSVKAVKDLSIEIPKVMAELRGAVFYSPNGTQLTVERNETQAYIIDREDFDLQLASRAVSSGATLFTSTRAIGIDVKDKVNVLINSQGKEEIRSCRVVVGADGVGSFVARKAGLYSKSSTELRLAAQEEFLGVGSAHSDFAQIFFGTNIAPGFFAWTVPSGTRRAKVGLCVKPGSGRSPIDWLNLFVSSNHNMSSWSREGTVSQQVVHAIPTGGTLRKTVSDGIVIVGDAAGQVKSTTGGGLYYGILCARLAGQTLVESLEKSEGTVSATELKNYESRWRERIGDEILFSCKARAFLDSLSDEEMDYIFQILENDKSLSKLIETVADIDYQSRIGKGLMARMAVSLIKKPRILQKATQHLLI
jgi:digeranylgeranylglycerophospholipid reductase